MTPEGKVKRDIKQFLNSLGADCWYYMPVPMGMGRAGIPDFIGCYRSRFFSIEAKAAGKAGATTPSQDREAVGIKAALGVIITADRIEWVEEMFFAYFGVRRG